MNRRTFLASLRLPLLVRPVVAQSDVFNLSATVTDAGSDSSLSYLALNFENGDYLTLIGKPTVPFLQWLSGRKNIQGAIL